MGKQLLRGVFVAWLVVGALPVAASAGKSPAAVAASVVAAVRAEHSFRFTVDATYNGVRITQVNDVSADRGIQKITVLAHGQTGHVTVLLVPAGVYFRADSLLVLNGYMGFDEKAAERYIGRWVFIPPTDSAFQTVADAVNTASALREIELSAPFSLPPTTTVAGRRVLVLKGVNRPGPGESTSGTMYLRASGPPLPVREVTESKKSAQTTTIDFSRWNEPVHITTPMGAVPIARTGLEPPSAPTLA